MTLDEGRDAIWANDRLGRREEARMIEAFLGDELAELGRQGRTRAFALAIDAPYGVGKSFFLKGLEAQLRLSHPVAHFDAWIDDANAEPLVAIMASIETALADYLKKKEVGKRLKEATAAALPIIGKAVVGAGGAFAKRWLGDTFSDAALNELDQAKDGTGAEKAVETLVDGVSDDISALVDREAQRMIDAYRRRQSSRIAFKRSMAALVQSLDAAGGALRSPLFVVIDELDRCRPDFAIRVLEEVKHFFDVEGVVFIFGIHGEQLSKSIRAVYGAEFDSDAYLRRFFSRKYVLRQPTMVELVGERLIAGGIDGAAFEYPSMPPPGRSAALTPAEFIAGFLGDFLVTTRELFLAIDMARNFVWTWKYSLAVELPLLLILIVHKIRDHDWPAQQLFPLSRFIMYHHFPGADGDQSRFDLSQLTSAYLNFMSISLPEVNLNSARGPWDYYVLSRLHSEFAARYPGGYKLSDKPVSLLGEYALRVERIAPFSLDAETMK